MATYVAIRALSRGVNIRVQSAFNRVQTVTIDATAGQFKLTFNGQQTADIAYNAVAATVLSALEALSNLAPGDVTVSGGPGGSGGTTPYIVTFGGTNYPAGSRISLTVQDGTTPPSGGGDVQTVTQTGGEQAKLSSTVDTIVDLDTAANRQALARHNAIGQWTVSAANAFDGAVALPTNS